MADEIKKMSIKEFRALGLVQEINRRLLHPLGLALEVIIDADGEESLGQVWDARDDPEGWIFGKGLIDPEKIKDVDLELEKRAHARIKAVGYIVQPPDGQTPE